MALHSEMQSSVDLCQQIADNASEEHDAFCEARPYETQPESTRLYISLDKVTQLQGVIQKMKDKYGVEVNVGEYSPCSMTSVADELVPVSIIGSPGDCKAASVRIVNILCFYGS